MKKFFPLWELVYFCRSNDALCFKKKVTKKLRTVKSYGLRKISRFFWGVELSGIYSNLAEAITFDWSELFRYFFFKNIARLDDIPQAQCLQFPNRLNPNAKNPRSDQSPIRPNPKRTNPQDEVFSPPLQKTHLRGTPAQNFF